MPADPQAQVCRRKADPEQAQCARCKQMMRVMLVALATTCVAASAWPAVEGEGSEAAVRPAAGLMLLTRDPLPELDRLISLVKAVRLFSVRPRKSRILLGNALGLQRFHVQLQDALYKEAPTLVGPVLRASPRRQPLLFRTEGRVQTVRPQCATVRGCAATLNFVVDSSCPLSVRDARRTSNAKQPTPLQANPFEQTDP